MQNSLNSHKQLRLWPIIREMDNLPYFTLLREDELSLSPDT